MKSKNGKQNSMIKAEVIGLLVGIILASLGTMLISYLVLNETVSLSSVGILCEIVLFLSSFLGSLSASKLMGVNNIKSGLIYAGLFVLILLILNVTLFSTPSSQLLISVLVVLLGSMVVCVNNIIPKKNRVYKKFRNG